VHVASDLGRPVVKVNTVIGAEGSASFTVRFTRPAADAGPLKVRTTPMVNRTKVAVEQPACG
jgi:hypothetical protein